jgi:hypothetical protein
MVPGRILALAAVGFFAQAKAAMKRSASGNDEVAKSSTPETPPDFHGRRLGVVQTWSELKEETRRRAVSRRVRVDSAGEHDFLGWDPCPTNLQLW